MRAVHYARRETLYVDQCLVASTARLHVSVDIGVFSSPLSLLPHRTPPLPPPIASSLGGNLFQLLSLPNLPLLQRSKMVVKELATPEKTPTLQATYVQREDKETYLQLQKDKAVYWNKT